MFCTRPLHQKLSPSLTCLRLLFVTTTSTVIGTRAWLPPPDAGNISQTITSPVCSANRSDFLVLFLVNSHPGNVRQRMLTRSSYPASEINALGFRRVFVLGSLVAEREPNPLYPGISDAEVQAESDRYSDIIRLNMTERYAGLLLKGLAAFAWAAEHCKHARFLVKTDDDVFIEQYTLRRYLDWVPHRADDFVIRGKKITHARPIRSPKTQNYASLEEYPPPRYPEYLSGPFYMMSPKTMSLLLKTSRSVPSIRNEDVFFTGLVANAAGVRREQIPILPERHTYSARCCLMRHAKRHQAHVFACSVFAFEQHKAFDAKHATRIKNHGRFCYFFECLPPVIIRLIDELKINCF